MLARVSIMIILLLLLISCDEDGRISIFEGNPNSRGFYTKDSTITDEEGGVLLELEYNSQLNQFTGTASNTTDNRRITYLIIDRTYAVDQ